MRYLKNKILLASAVFLLAGCQKPEPLSLVGPGGQTPPRLDVISPDHLVDGLYGTTDIDSTKFFPALDSKHFGSLLIEGSQYDAKGEHHYASVTRAIFFNRLSPVFLGADTVYRTLDLGKIMLDRLLLRKVDKRFHSRDASVDSLLGIQYVLFNKDGTGGAGFSFEGAHTYDWIGEGTASIPPFDLRIDSPTRLRVLFPSPDNPVSMSDNLAVRWIGGGANVQIFIRSADPHESERFLYYLKVNENLGGIVIPRGVMNLLPRDQSDFLFTFSSSTRSVTTIQGFPDPVEIRTITNHTLRLSRR
jgi:hypothetical protein